LVAGDKGASLAKVKAARIARRLCLRFSLWQRDGF
jgi:hypothetical protein